MIKLNMIGAGRVGQTLGYLFVKNNLAKLCGVVNRRLASAEEAILWIGEGQACESIEQLPYAEFTLITTPDALIESTCMRLAASGVLRKGDVVVHCSGLQTSDCLFSAKEQGCLIASVHPLRSFSDPKTSVGNYTGTFCALEGDEQAITWLTPLFDAIGSLSSTIAKDKKALYHAGSVFASNYLVTLAAKAEQCFQAAGIQEAMAMPLVMSLMQSTFVNLSHTQKPELALTGPIQRGDCVTVYAHVQAFDACEDKILYSALGQETLRLTNLDDEKKQRLTDFFAVELGKI